MTKTDSFYPDINSSSVLNKYEFSKREKSEKIYQDPEQLVIRNLISKNTIYDNMLLFWGTGVGKCHGRDTPILMYDGSIKKVQDVQLNDLLMGDDSTPRKVLTLTKGESELFNVSSPGGETYTVNEEHILCLKDRQSNRILQVPVKSFDPENALEGYRVPVHFQEQTVPEDPYTFGNQQCLNSIPLVFKCNSRSNRLKLLNGFVAAANANANAAANAATAKLSASFSKYNEIVVSTAKSQLIQDILFVVRSLGFGYNCQVETENTRISIQRVFETETFQGRVHVNSIGRDQYYGFSVDKNHRYLLGDFTVTHNSCAAITVAEGMKEYSLSMGRKIFVLVKNENIKQNFKNELLTDCARNAYITKAEENAMMIANSNATTNDLSINTLKERIEKRIKNVYTFVTYGSFVNRVLGTKVFESNPLGLAVPKQKKDSQGVGIRIKSDNALVNLNNTLIIVDEAHNLTNNDIYTALFTILQKSYNYRLIMLTATPVFDNPKEIFEICNLLNAHGVHAPIRSDLYKGNQPFIVKLGDVGILNGGVSALSEEGQRHLRKTMKGKVSYLEQNTNDFPVRIDMGVPLQDKVGSIKVVPCYMHEYQFEVYKRALKTDDKKSFANEATENAFINEALVTETGNTGTGNETLTISDPATGTGSLYKNSNDASTMAFPGYLYGKEGFLAQDFTDAPFLKYDGSLKEHSCKFYKMLTYLKENPGTAFIYSNYVTYGGTSLIKKLLEANGYTEYRRSSHLNDRPFTFAMYDDQTTSETREGIRIAFNSKQNRYGSLIKILIGSPIISEGITLKNVRQVHILEPPWNMSKINQIIGRAVRNKSHIDLPVHERTVQVYKYTAGGIVENPTQNQNHHYYFIDNEKYLLCEKKDRVNKKVERILKEISFNCAWRVIPNRMIQDRDKETAKCDYMQCDYQCALKPTNGILDKFTYNINIDYFDAFDIETNKAIIKQLFKVYSVWSIADIYNQIGNVTVESVYATLNQMIQSKTILTDQYNREGFLIQKQNFIIFNPVTGIHGSVYSKMFNFSENVNRYTLAEYALLKLNLDLDTTKKTGPKEKNHELITLSPEDTLHNQNIINHFKLYGSYRERPTKKSGGILGPVDHVFRIIDTRPTSEPPTKDQIEDDKRKAITGMRATSFKKPKLFDMINYLEITPDEMQEYIGYPSEKISLNELSVGQIITIIEKHLTKKNLIIH